MSSPRWWMVKRPAPAPEIEGGGYFISCHAGAPPLRDVGGVYAPTMGQAALVAVQAFPRAGLNAGNIVIEAQPTPAELVAEAKGRHIDQHRAGNWGY